MTILLSIIEKKLNVSDYISCWYRIIDEFDKGNMRVLSKEECILRGSVFCFEEVRE